MHPTILDAMLTSIFLKKISLVKVSMESKILDVMSNRTYIAEHGVQNHLRDATLPSKGCDSVTNLKSRVGEGQSDVFEAPSSQFQ